ncbi:MAG TPA: ABC transporter substrate-binding protein [Xanthobacteraceae bacterium]|nr:ABC transporter substrate-binding protein [Xanthobacteraceae bacterium]
MLGFAMRFVALAATACALAVLVPGAPRAQEPPALQRATGADKERLKRLIEEAKQEGAVSYIDGLITPGTHDLLSAAFKKHYGLPDSFKVGNTYGAPVTIITRMTQEMQANRYTIDVVGVASPAWVQGRDAEGKIAHYASPEYANYKRALDQKMGLKDHFIANAAYTFAPTWNAETTKFDGNSWKDMVKIADLAPAGRYSSSDCAVSDSTLQVYMGVRQIVGLDDYKKLAEGRPVYTYKSEQTLARLVSGEDIFALYGLTSNIPKFNERGAKLRHLVPKEGYVLLPQVMFITAGAPHPSAAKLWFDFVLSQEGQEIFVKSDSVFSVRGGFKSPRPEIPPFDEMKTISMDWLKITEQDLQNARNEWLTMFRGSRGRPR